MSTKGQGHSLTLVQITRFQFLNFFFSVATWPIEARFYVESLGMRERKLTLFRSHDQDGHYAIYGKIL